MRKILELNRKVIASILAVTVAFGCVPLTKASNVQATDSSTYKTSFVADTYTDGATADDYKIYNLLNETADKITLKRGDIWTVSAYVTYRSSQRPAGSSLKAEIGFSLLGNEEAHGDVSVYNGHFHYLGTNASSGEAELLLPDVNTYYDWQDGWGWKVKFTVKAYESVTLYMTNASDVVKWDKTIAWSDLYRLKDISEASGVTFNPSFVFQNTDAEVSNISVDYVSGQPSYITELTADTYTAGATEDAYKVYNLLEASSEGIKLQKGDVWTVSAYVMYRSPQCPSGSSLKAEIGFSLLGNEEAHGDVSVYNGHFHYLGISASSGEAELLSPDTTWNNWEDGWGWKVKFTVKPYESVTLYMTNASDVVKWDKTIAWNELYRLKDIAETSGVTFNPSFVFQNTDAEVSDISVEYVAGEETGPSYVTELTADTYTSGATTDTYEVYSILDASSEKVELKLGDVWTVSAYVTYRSSQRPAGSNLKAEIGFSLLGNEEAHGDVSVYNGHFHYLGTNASSGEAELVSPDMNTYYDWQDGWGWKVKFIVKAYKSVTLYMTNASDVVKWDKTIAWSELYRLKDISETSGVTFEPSFVFQNTDAIVSDIKVTYGKEDIGPIEPIEPIEPVTKAPVMGEEDINMAEGKTLPSTFTGHDNIKLDIGKIVATTENPTWYYSGSFSYSSFVNGYGGLNVTFGEGIHNGSRKDMTVTARIHKENGVVVDTQIVLWTGVNGEVLYLNGSSIKYNTETNYTFTVKVSENKISFWINDTQFVDAVDLAAKGVTELRPKFGFNANGTAGTIADIKIWGDLAGVEAATRPDSVANLTLECEQFNSFVPSLKYYYDNEKINIEDDSWYFSGNFVYNSMPDYGGITFVFGEGTYTTAASSNKAPITGTREISVTARPGGYAGSVRKTQTVIWVDAEPVHVGEVPGFSYETGKEYKWTVEVEDGLLTFWIDGKLIYDEIDLSAYGITNLQPYFGILPDGSSGKISNVEIWDTTIEDAKPTFTNKDINSAVLSEVKVSASTGRMLYDGVTFTDGGEYYYSADVKEQSGEDNIRLVVAKIGEATVEVYYDGTKVHLVKSSNGQDTEIASKAVSVDVAEKCNYVIKYSDGKISVWINHVLVLCKVAVEGSTPVAGIATNSATGTVTNIKLWGDTSQTGGIVYQKFADISSYRGKTKTYPQANGYVFGGWYQDADEEKAVAAETNGGAAYAKMVPEEVLSIKTQVLKDTMYASNKTNLRFITSVDSLQYLDVNITLKSQGKTRKFTGLDVYKAITVAEGEAKIQDSPSKLFCSHSEYLFTVNMKNLNSFDLAWTVVPGWTTLDGTEVAGVETEVAVNDKFNKHIAKEELGLNGSTLLQIASSGSSSIMSYVIKTANNKVIVIDGGNKEDADYLAWVLKNRYQVSKVDAWYVTHEDVAHYGALETILSDNMISVQKIYYNFLAKSDSAFKQLLKATSGAEEVGQITHQYGDVKVHVINDSKVYASGYEQNAGNADKATMVLLAEFGGTKNTGVLFLGDLTSDTEACIVKQAADRNIDLKGKVLQMAGHSGSACSKAFYEHLKPSVALWPAVLGTWDGSVSLRNFLSKNGVAEHYSSSQNNYEFY